MLILTASGTGGLEATATNLISHGDKVLVAHCGVFGKRWADIAEAFGAKVIHIEFPPGKAIAPQIVRDKLRVERNVKLVLATHNETSTGVVNDIAALAKVIQAFGKARPIFAVDAISSLGAINLPMDELQIDVVVGASQKALMAPPGLAFVALSPRAWTAVKRASNPRFYWDFLSAQECAIENKTPFTPAITVLYALSESLRLILDDGLSATFARHKQIGAKMRAGVKQLGLKLFAEESWASDTLTAIQIPDGWQENDLIYELRRRHSIVVGGGIGYPIIRVGHMGYVTIEDVEIVLKALEEILMNYPVENRNEFLDI